MSENQQEQHQAPASDAMKALIRRAVATGGFALGPLQAEDQPQWAESLIQQFNDAGPKTRCPHLVSEDRVALWVSLAPDLIACSDCEGELIQKVEERLGHPLSEEPGKCSACGTQGLVRGVSIGVGKYLLRGLICSACEEETPPDVPPSFSQAEDGEDETPQSLKLLDLPPIRIDRDALQASADLGDFEEKAWEMLGRAGRLSERLIEAVRRHHESIGRALDLDQAVIGGLLIRGSKLTRAIFDSTQAEESEAHATLSRSLAETAITLCWLVDKNDPVSYRRFRADSLARWRWFLEETEGEGKDEDATSRALTEKVQQYIDAELQSGGLEWDDVPARPNSWGPPMRQQFEDLGQLGVYNALFATHSSYVHPTWHEIRNFHLAPAENGFHLDPTYGGMVPVAAYLLSQLVAEACLAAQSVLPSDIDPSAFGDAVAKTIHASRLLSLEFSDFIARGALDAQFERVFPAL